MTTPEQEQGWREEAERLALLPKEEQRQIIALHRHIASNPSLSKREREEGQAHADALERHLRRLNRTRKSQGN